MKLFYCLCGGRQNKQIQEQEESKQVKNNLLKRKSNQELSQLSNNEMVEFKNIEVKEGVEDEKSLFDQIFQNPFENLTKKFKNSSEDIQKDSEAKIERQETNENFENEKKEESQNFFLKFFENEEEQKKINQEIAILRKKSLIRPFTLSFPLEQSDYQKIVYLVQERESDVDWENKKNKEKIKIWIKNDSLYKKGCPFYKSSFIFDSFDGKLNIDDIIYLMFDYSTRKSYDNNILVYKELKKISENEVVQQMVSKVGIPFVKDREFIDTRIQFNCQELNEQIVYFKTADEKQFPYNDKYQKAFTVLSANFIKKLNDNEIQLWTFGQFDSGAMLPQSFLNKILSSSFEKWFEDFQILTKNHVQKRTESSIS